MAPVAARLSLGLDPDQLGVPHDALVDLDWPAVRRLDDGLEGSVLLCDSFGNVLTDLTRAMLPPRPADERITCRDHEVQGLSASTAMLTQGTPVALFSSSDRLELAQVDTAGRRPAGATPGNRVSVRWGTE